jgi:transmembrane sensor
MVVGAKSGSYRFDVVPNPARQFVVHVASVTVRVLGTQFVVAKTGGRAEVRVERGRVEVTWPEGRTELGVGESGWFPPEPPALAAAAASTVPSPWPSAVKGPPSTKNRAQFIELSRQGNYQAAYAMIDRTPTPFEGSAEDLMMAADAARLSNHPSQAIVYLQRITRDYSRDSRAPLAAFTIGRICMNQLARPAAAAEAFGLVRRLAPAGALVQDALAREAEALEQAGQHAAAQRLVEEYLKLSPSGRSRERLRQLGKPTKSE